MSSARRVAVHMAIEAGHAPQAVGLLGLAIGGRIELLLRELRDEQSQAFQVLGVQDAGKELLKVIDRDNLALRHVAQVGTRRQEHGWWELGQKGIRQIKIEIEAFQAFEGLDLGLREYHAPHLVLRVRQRQESFGEQPLIANGIARHIGQLFPGVTPWAAWSRDRQAMALPRQSQLPLFVRPVAIQLVAASSEPSSDVP